ncbi:urease accessory protein [Paramagnetospirillum marisnigri]|uniref:Urease accessory protein UreD n=1 Tax=Paramagnetospirillum marisnigri TaxID=1285242 RepID=A0A178MBX7_9PROT|nr:urease accessory protein UreD [Paramagnetospirillum marisnigri]OAN45657.1 urease accessory protein [Paramagnetospirillum marisnigri]
MRGKAEITFGRDRLAHLFQQAPLRALFPTPPDGEPPQAALVTTSGGLAGGDRLDLSVTVDDGGAGLVVASAAEKIYRSTGPDTEVEIALAAGSGSWLEFLPQETIAFDGSRLRRTTRLDLAADARALAGEMLVFGRTARGERLSHGLLRDAWDVRRDGRLIWADALHLDGDIAAKLDAPAGFDGANACATLVLAAPAPERLRDLIRDGLADYDGRAGATVVAGLVIARWLDRDAARLRKSFGAAWAMLRHEAAGLPRRLPRLWEI